MEKQNKLEPAELKKYRSFIIGLALPAGDHAGFVSYFGITKDERKIVLLDEIESGNLIELTEQLKWFMTKFKYRGGSYREAGDFIFGDSTQHIINEFLRNEYKVQIKHSSILYGKDEQRPFLLLLPEINKKRKDKTIIIGDEFLLSLRLKDELLQNPAAIQYDQFPALESLCFAYYGWQELIKDAENPPPVQDIAIMEFNSIY